MIPFAMYASLSMLNFWVPHKAVPARVALSAIMVLATTNLATSLPRKNTFLDGWYSICLVYECIAFALTVVAVNGQLDRCLRTFAQRQLSCLSAILCRRNKAHLEHDKEEQDEYDHELHQRTTPCDVVRCICGYEMDAAADLVGRRIMPAAFIATIVGYYVSFGGHTSI